MTQKYYSVTVNNKFAGLNLDSDHDEILAEKPAHLIAAEQAASAAASQEQAKKHESRRAGARGGNQADNRVPRKPRGPARDYDADAVRDTRSRDAGDATHKVASSDYKKFEGRRDGQRKQDRRGGNPKPAEDADPKHQEHDAIAAVEDAAAEAVGSEEPATPEPVRLVEPEPEVKSVKQYLAETRGDRYVIEEPVEVVEKYDALEKEMVEAGFVCKGGKQADEVHVKKSTKAIRKTPKTGVQELGEIAPLPKLQKKERRVGSKGAYGDNRDSRKPEDKKVPTPTAASPDSIVKGKKKAYKDHNIFPGLE